MSLSNSLKTKLQLWLKRLLVLPFILSSLGVSAKSKPLPEVKVIESNKKSLDSAILSMVVSDSSISTEEIPKTLTAHLIFTDDLALTEIKAIEDLIKDTSVENSLKVIRLSRYTTGDSRVSEVLVKAFKAGISVKIITDSNPIMTFSKKFKDDSASSESTVSKSDIKFISDLSLDLLKDANNEGSAFIRSLIAGGLSFGKEIILQPLYNDFYKGKATEMIPIMHEKALLLSTGKVKKTIFSTANLARNPRYNRLFVVDDPDFYDIYLQHFDELAKTYLSGKETKDISSMPRYLIKYKDGSTIEMSFTDGKYNPNDRISSLLNNESNTLVEGLFSEFVFTNSQVKDALIGALNRNPKAKVFIIGDDRFSEMNGWGLFPLIGAGITLYRKFGGSVEGLSFETQKQIESYVYQRVAADPESGDERIEITEDGPPTSRHVWHDKTASFKIQTPEGKVEDVIFTGSFNLSNNSANSEFQVEMRPSTNSWIQESIRFSVKKVVEKNPTFAVPTLIATIRNVLGNLFGLTDLEVTIETANSLYKASLERDRTKIQSILDDVSKIKTNLKVKLSQDSINKRKEKMNKLIQWYFDSFSEAKDIAKADTRFKKFIGLALAVAKKSLKPKDIENIVKQLSMSEDGGEATSDILNLRNESVKEIIF